MAISSKVCFGKDISYDGYNHVFKVSVTAGHRPKLSFHLQARLYVLSSAYSGSLLLDLVGLC